MAKVKGVVVEGIGDAVENLKLQKSFFVNTGLDGKFFDNGTINVDISPHEYALAEPDHECKDIEWKPGFKENFSFIKLKLAFKDREHDGYLYIPSRSPNGNKIMEILTEHIPEISIGESVELIIPNDKLTIK